MIREAVNTDIPQLKKLWMDVFGDGEAFLTFFFEQTFSELKVLVYEEQGKIIGMLYAMDCQWNRKIRGYYLYALATEKAFRGQGIMGQLIGEITRMAERENLDFLFLEPAEESLFTYYDRFHFQRRMDRRELELTGMTAHRMQTGQGNLIAQEMKEETIPRKFAEVKSVSAWSGLLSRTWKETNVSLQFTPAVSEFVIREWMDMGAKAYQYTVQGMITGYLIVREEQGEPQLLFYGTDEVEESLAELLREKKNQTFTQAYDMSGQIEGDTWNGLVPF